MFSILDSDTIFSGDGHYLNRVVSSRMKSIHGLAISASIKLFNIIDVISLVSTEQLVDCIFLSNMLYEKQVKLISQEND